MNYKLAKELKDNGFKQNKPVVGGGYYINETPKEEDCAYIPSLSELIEATRDYEYKLVIKKDAIICLKDYPDNLNEIIAEGKDLEEVLVKLYIKLK